MIRSRWRQLPLLLLVWLLAGCGGLPHSQSDMERAKTALETALESWKKGEPTDKLKSLPEPIDFFDEDRKAGVKLLDFRVADSGYTDKEFIRYTSQLTLQDRRGKRIEKASTYLIVPTKTPIGISRDPYF